MRLEWLRCFNEVAQTGSFTKAAQNLYMTQPAVTKIIRTLEIEAREKLFVRSTAGVQLTEAGKIFRRFAYKVLNDYDQYQAEMQAYQNISSQFAGTIELAVSPLLLQTYYGDIFKQLTDHFPDSTLHFIESSLDTTLQLIKENPQTLGLMLIYPTVDLPVDRSIVVQRLVSSEMIFCASGRSKYAKQTDLHAWEDFTNDELIAVGMGKYNTIFPQGSYNFYTTNLSLIAQKLLNDTAVCAIVPQLIAEKVLLSADIVRLDVQEQPDVWIAFLYNRAALDLKFYSQAFLERFQKALQNIF